MNLDTTIAGSPVATVGHRGAVSMTSGGLLHAIGENIRSQAILPTPLSAVSAQWAVVSYLWSLRPPAAPPVPSQLRLSPYARAFSGRARGAWSEVMGIGVAAVMLRRSLLPGETYLGLWDVDRGWLAWAVAHGLIAFPVGGSKRRPDYLAARLTHNGPEILCIECKGSDGGRLAGTSRLAKGIPQVMSVGPAALPLRRWVVGAACSRNIAGTWHPQLVEVPVEPALPGTSSSGIAGALGALKRAASVSFLAGIGERQLAAIALGRDDSAHDDHGEPADEWGDDRGRAYRGRTLQIRIEGYELRVFLGLDEAIRESFAAGDVDGAVEQQQTRAAEFRFEREVEGGYAEIDSPAEQPVSISESGTLLKLDFS